MRSQPTEAAAPGPVLDGYAQVFFLHIPKTAGRSFQRFLREDSGLGEVLRLPPDQRFFAALASAERYPVVHGHAPYPVTSVLAQPLFVITFLRSPVERAVSAFEYVERRGDRPVSRVRRERGIQTIADLADSNRASNLQTLLLGVDYELEPVLERFKSGELGAREARAELRRRAARGSDAGTLERAKQRLERIEFIGITEAFDDSLRLFAHRIGHEAPLASYRANAAPAAEREAREARYSAGDLDAVAADNRLDQQLYERGVEIFRSRYEQAFGDPPELPVASTAS